MQTADHFDSLPLRRIAAAVARATFTKKQLDEPAAGGEFAIKGKRQIKGWILHSGLYP